MQLSFPFDLLFDATKRRRSGNRHVALPDGMIEYALERRRGRSISIRVKKEGVSVRAPRWTPLQEIEAFIREKSAWIRARRADFERQPPGFDWRDGGEICVFGETVVIRVKSVTDHARAVTTLVEQELRVPLGHAADEHALKEKIVAWLRAEGLRRFEEQCATLATQLGLQPPRVTLSNAKGRWGSCSARSGIRLSWRLALLPRHLTRYVIAHEIAHLVHMDHSPRFWAVVEQIHPGCKASRRELRKYELSLPA